MGNGESWQQTKPACKKGSGADRSIPLPGTKPHARQQVIDCPVSDGRLSRHRDERAPFPTEALPRLCRVCKEASTVSGQPRTTTSDSSSSRSSGRRCGSMGSSTATVVLLPEITLRGRRSVNPSMSWRYDKGPRHSRGARKHAGRWIRARARRLRPPIPQLKRAGRTGRRCSVGPPLDLLDGQIGRPQSLTPVPLNQQVNDALACSPVPQIGPAGLHAVREDLTCGSHDPIGIPTHDVVRRVLHRDRSLRVLP